MDHSHCSTLIEHINGIFVELGCETVSCQLGLWLQVDPLAPHPSGQELLEMYRALQATEKDVLQASNCVLVTGV